MNMSTDRYVSTVWRAFCAVIVSCSLSSIALAQLEITEVMFDPIDENFDGTWEWIEVRNTGATDIDLNGAFLDRLGDNALDTGAVSPNIETGVVENTVIPAGSVAVLYDAFNFSAANFIDQPFRDAWGLSASVPLVGVSFFPPLTNGGTAVGVWQNAASYNLDVIDDPENPGTNIVGSFNNALVSLDYRTGFPAGNNMASMQWNGTGSNSDGANWALTQSGVNGAVTSVASSLVGAPINNAADVGNPGLNSGAAPSGSLLITEVMYNPASSDNDWEWVEVYNNTGALIDFATAGTVGNEGYVFDDNDNNDLLAPNVTSGSIANGTSAILYDGAALSAQDVEDAWDPGGVENVNFIPVSDFTALTNGGAENGDTIALWDNFDDYTGETTTGQGRSTDNAAVALTYENNLNGWPDDNGFSSVYLINLGLDPSVGANWALASSGDLIGSFNAAEVFGSGGLAVHDGGDVGSPGSFAALAPADADFDDDGDVDADDLAAWILAFGGAATGTTGDANNDGDADGGDFLDWQRQFTGPASLGASTVPEPSSIVLFGLALAVSAGRRRR